MGQPWTRTSLATFIRSHGDEMMQAWETRVRSEVAAASDQGTAVLRNTLADFLWEMAEKIEPDVSNAPKRSPAHGKHGKQRSSVAAYSLPQVMKEYGLLRVTMLDELEGRNALPVSLRNELLACIDAAMFEAASAFADDKRERERRGRIDAEAECDRVKLAAEVLRGELKAVERASAVLSTERDTSRARMAVLTADAGLRERFVATLAHDLRTPLGAIKMAFELLLAELPQRREVTELTDLLFRNLGRTDTMLRDLLDSHRIHAGHRLPLHLASCNLTEIARTTLKDLAAEYGPRFELQAEPVVCGFWDAERLRRALDNLVTNAIKYGDRNKPISILIAQNERETTLAVHNFGFPILPEDQTALFEPYYRTKPAESGQAKGWGLGLTLVGAVAEGHRGKVRVASSAGEGTTFTVSLPNDPRLLQCLSRGGEAGVSAPNPTTH